MGVETAARLRSFGAGNGTISLAYVQVREASEYLRVSGDTPMSPNYILRGGVEKNRGIAHT